MKYILEVQVPISRSHWRALYYQPKPTTPRPIGYYFVAEQEDALRFDSEEKALELGLPAAIARIKDLLKPRDPMGALAGFRTETKHVRETARVIAVEG